MIDWFFGKPRSGKTYRAVKIIYDQYLNENIEPDFKNILTNIGGIKFDFLNRFFSDNGLTSMAYKLIWKDFYKHISKLYDMAINEKNDDELNRYADYHKINDSLIIVDEASIYLKKYDDVISWFLAYHGHFRIRLIFIAQHPKQIYSEYLTHTEIYYEAQPQSKQLLNNQLRYIHYDDFNFSKTSRCGADTITTSQDIYNLYKSGFSDKPKKVIYQYIFLMIIAFFVFIGLIYYLIQSMSSSASFDSNDSIISSGSSPPLIGNIPQNKFLLKIRCDDFECWNIDTKYKNKKISLSYVKFIVLNNRMELFFYEQHVRADRTINFNGMSIKQPISNLTDFYYLIDEQLKQIYFSELFILKDLEKRKTAAIFEGGAVE